jgi:CRISPR-associated protein Cas10/Cmr2 subtype III-B
MALLPADTRIPDHTIWSHMQVVSALAGCIEEGGKWQPAFLRFQLGPVQEFIAAARSVRDLWSGSYLLSWLMAAGLKALSEDAGPDAVIFPNLREQPLFDLHWRREIWDRFRIGDKPIWDSMEWDNEDLLTPNLPNVFLAIVPAGSASRLAERVKAAMEAEWQSIARAVWDACSKAGLTADEPAISADERELRFHGQVDTFLTISWQATPWPGSLDEALELGKAFREGMPIPEACNRVRAIVEMAQELMPKEHRDPRFYVKDQDRPNQKLNNLGLAWSIMVAQNQWELDAVRQTRTFSGAAGGWQAGVSNNKDALTGKAEAVAGGEEWQRRAYAAKGFWASLFKKKDWLGAATLIKRVWHQAYLAKSPWSLGTDSKLFPMPNTRGVAAHRPFEDCGEEEVPSDSDPSEKYFAVLALDGDRIGKWVSGELTPRFATQLANYTDGSGVETHGSKPYFSRPEFKDFCNQQRPLSPSYHLQFSEALSNFALRCAREIVEAYQGRLIYAGGDDVLALLPANASLECAKALRDAFQGKAVANPSNGHALFTSPAPGFLAGNLRDNQGEPIPFLVPGPEMDCSVGIAIAHFKAPLQDVVRAAQSAEKRAKRDVSKGGHGRSAVAVTLVKRSGEVIEWGAKWEGGLELYEGLASAMDAGQLSGRFPHRLAQLLEPYTTEFVPAAAMGSQNHGMHGFPVDEVIRREFEHCLKRQRGQWFPQRADEAQAMVSGLTEALTTHLESLGKDASSEEKETPDFIQRRLRSVIGLCQTLAFAHRTGGGERNQKTEPEGNA